jgi:hypothetical protein
VKKTQGPQILPSIKRLELILLLFFPMIPGGYHRKKKPTKTKTKTKKAGPE